MNRGKMMKWLAANMAIAAVALATGSAAHAEAQEVRIFRQYSLPYLALMVMEDQKLLERHAAAAGVDVAAQWSVVSIPSAVNDALLSGNLDFASAGVNAFLTVWDKTLGTNSAIHALGAYNASPFFLNTRNPAVHSIRDFTDNDKIAVPAVGVSIMALVLQMATANEYGMENYDKLNHLTVSLPQAEATAAMMSGELEITANFSVAPFQYLQLQNPDIRKVLSSYDVLGGPLSMGVVYTTDRYYAENPEIVAAFRAAYAEANQFIESNPEQAARTYQRMSKDSMKLEDIVNLIKDPDFFFDTVPRKTKRLADFMHDIGRMKNRIESWQDLFFPEVHSENGS